MIASKIPQVILVTFLLFFTSGLHPVGVYHEEVILFGSFEDYVKNKPLKVFTSKNDFKSDKRLKNKNRLIRVIRKKTDAGQVLGVEFFIPRVYEERYRRLFEYGSRKAGNTKKMISVFDSLENLFRKRAIRIYKSDSCESDFNNDSHPLLKNKARLIKIVYFYNKDTESIYLTEHKIPRHLLDGYLRKMVEISGMTPGQAEQVRQKRGEFVIIEYDHRDNYIDEARKMALKRKYERPVSDSKATMASTLATSVEQASEKVYYLHKDGNGTVTAVTDGNGKLVERVEYTPYGVPTFWDFTRDPENPVSRSRSVIGNDVLFHGRKYDHETGLYYYRNRYYDPTTGRFLQTDPLGYKASLNLYQAFNNNPVNFTDPLGLEPVKRYAGTVADFVYAMNNSKSRVGRKRGSRAEKTLLYLGKISFKKGIPLPAATAPFNNITGRYIYTQKGGWIDMSHFLFYAGRAYFHKVKKENAGELLKDESYSFMSTHAQFQIARDAHMNPRGEAMQEGFTQEKMDSLLKKAAHSAYSYEDLPSDQFGINFALQYFNPNSSLTLAEQVSNFLTYVLGATIPSAAPNWTTMPVDHTKNPPTRTNKTATPVYTNSEAQKLKKFVQWLESLFK